MLLSIAAANVTPALYIWVGQQRIKADSSSWQPMPLLLHVTTRWACGPRSLGRERCSDVRTGSARQCEQTEPRTKCCTYPRITTAFQQTSAFLDWSSRNYPNSAMVQPIKPRSWNAHFFSAFAWVKCRNWASKMSVTHELRTLSHTKIKRSR